MKKLMAIVLAALMLVGMFALPTMAAEKVPTCVQNQIDPEWLITEVCNDQKGTVDSAAYGYDESSGIDPFEYIEIYNNSDRTLNLYEYCLTYQGSGNTSSNFETQIKEITPFLTNNTYSDEVGNYIDGSPFYEAWKNGTPLTSTKGDGSTLVMNDSLKNPKNCDVAPGECVIIWMPYYEAYLSKFNDGQGMTMANFRAFHGIPDDVKVIIADANSDTGNGGNAHNFNVKNSDCGTYGIAKYSDELNLACNTPKADGGQADGIMTEGYSKYEPMVTWASVDLAAKYQTGVNPTKYFNLVPDIDWVNAETYDWEWSGGRMIVLESDANPTPGSLTDQQKLFICPETLQPGTKINFMASNTLGVIYAPEKRTGDTRMSFKGYNINGVVYDLNTEFTVPAEGVTSFSYEYVEEKITLPTDEPYEPDTTPVETTTETPTEEVTTTAAPTETDKPEADPPAEEKGCAGIAVAAQLIAIICSAGIMLVIKKK